MFGNLKKCSRFQKLCRVPTLHARTRLIHGAPQERAEPIAASGTLAAPKGSLCSSKAGPWLSPGLDMAARAWQREDKKNHHHHV